MGSLTDANIKAWQEQTGIEPATGERLQILTEMSDAAFALIKIIELEKSGIRDGDGCWHGSDVVGGAAGDLCRFWDLLQSHDRQLRDCFDGEMIQF